MLTPLTLTSIILACVAFFIAVFLNGRLMKRLYDVTRRYKKSAESEVRLINAKMEASNKMREIATSLCEAKNLLRDISIGEPNSYGMSQICEGTYKGWYVAAFFGKNGYPVVIKDFATDDEAYNKMAAEELLEKLNEKV